MLLDAMYVCSSPFQIMTAIILAKENGEKADIYINGFFNQYEKYKEMLIASGVFRGVFTVPYDVYVKYFNKNGRFAPRLQALNNYLFPNRIAESFISKGCFYKKIYSANRDIICRYVQFYHFKHKVSSELILFEEGNSVYTKNSVLQENPSEKMLRKMLYGKKAVAPSKLFLYSPNLFVALRKHSAFDVRSINVSDSTVESLKGIFDDIERIPCGSAIIIDTHKSAIFGKKEKREIEEMYNTIADKLNTIIYLKRHPREPEDSFNIGKLIDDNIPFELLCTEAFASTYILISYISTALATPKLMFDKEPYILLLYRLVKSTVDVSTVDNYYHELKMLYTNPEKIFIPKTEEELMRSICIINSKLSKSGNNHESEMNQ